MIASRKPAPRLLRVVAGLVAASMSCTASAALITVGPDPDCTTSSLPAALLVASLNGTDFDEIRVMQGTYTNVALTSTGISYSLTGGYNHCRFDAQVVGRTNLSGNFVDPVLWIKGATTAYRNVTLAHLNISNGGDRLAGGGISAENLRLVLKHAAVLNNSAAGIYLKRDGVAISGILELQGHVVIAHNSNAAWGGGIRVDSGTLRIRPDATEIHSNDSGWDGGGIYAANSDILIGSFGEPEVDGSASGLTIRDNTAGHSGGGVYIYNGLLDFRETAVLRNTAGSYGGGVYAVDAQVQIGRESMGLAVQCPGEQLCSRFVGNAAGADCPRSTGSGGAIFLNGSRAHILQTYFASNCAEKGAILSVMSNATNPAGAIDIEGIVTRNNVSQAPWTSIAVTPTAPPPVRIRYSTLTGDFMRRFTETGQTDTLVAPVAETTLSPDRYIRMSILETAIPYGWSLGTTECNLSANWQWASMFRDGLNGDFRLAATSPAIDACNAAVAPTESLDIERKLRCEDSPAHPDQLGRCDIGAFEYDSDPFGYGFGNSFE